MKTEFEATFENVDKNEIRAKLKEVGATLVHEEYLQRRIPFYIPGKEEDNRIWARVREEYDKTTMSVKQISGDRIEDQKETEITINSFEDGVELLKEIGCIPRSYQENKRERWELDGVEVVIDEWPFLEPLVEVEGESEEVVKAVSLKLGFDYADALFCAVTELYNKKYNIDANIINEKTPRIVFDMDNPFVV